jgi:hypothetical protein
VSDTKDPKSEPGPVTLPPDRVSIVDVPGSDRPSLEAIPSWAADLLRRFNDAQEREQEARDQAHRAAATISAAFLKTEATVELARQSVLGCRADLREMGRQLSEMEYRIDQKILDMETRLDKRFEAVEARVAALEATRKP